jgi:hypothetical protein
MVQEKNITYPTDSKLQKKIIDNCIKIAKQEGIICEEVISEQPCNLLETLIMVGILKEEKRQM